MTKTKILVAGIGGVGGYYGGLLAKHFTNNDNVEINFLARGQHLKEINKNGLKVLKGEMEFIARPKLASDNSADIGIADLIVLSTKSYDLESVVQQLSPCIGGETIILPLLNGVDSKERIKRLFPNNMVLDGCAYIVSRIIQDGVIQNSGNIHTLYFGLDNYMSEKLSFFENLFKQATIEATLSERISSIIWEKYIFISPTATATAYHDAFIGELISNKEYFETLIALIIEVQQIAKVKRIEVPDDIIEIILKKLKSLPFDSTSSMHSDFIQKKAVTELESLTGYVLREGLINNVATPMYSKVYADLKKRCNA